MSYQTKQRALLQHFLTENAQKHFFARELLDYAHKKGIGAATVYRFLDKMTREGTLNKYNSDAGNGACYQWHDADSMEYHFICNDCGKCFHVACEHLENVGAHLLKDHNFEVDLSKTVFCGRCATCSQKENL